ncbi:MAG: DUF4956 domain-containing protein [Chloroflexi bacterium HGW-Chloroflexi-10]|nr:MAG: DUF4956 domain-containing protein [Chloroflexi bacterium HGW-Chloroflexi-10]
MPAFFSFILGFLFNFAVALTAVRFIYYPKTHNKRYVFTFLSFNTIIYFVLSFMTSIEISVGVGFGLFAIFSILRYRTEPMPIREMTYLFIITALPVMNSAASNANVWGELFAANLIVLGILFILERGWGFRYESTKRIVYEKIENIKRENRPALIADLEERTGLKIKRVVVGKINFLKDVAEVQIHFDDPEQQDWLQSNGVMVYTNDDEA